MRDPRPIEWLRFWLEQLMIRGPHYQLLLVAIVLALISLVGGTLVMVFAGGFDSPGDAVWWAFLRLTDPGYLGDDEGVLRRIVSTILTVLGYVVFLGLLIAILTSWLLRTTRRLESGVTPIAARNHIVIIGWAGRTATLVAELLRSEGRIRRFLELRGAKRLRIAVLADEIGHEVVQELKDRVAEHWQPRQVTLRSGSSLRPDHLERVDFLNAAAVLVPAQDAEGGRIEAVDSRTIKALLSLGNHPLARSGSELPLAVAEVRDARKIPIARQAYPGPIEIVASDATISRLIAQNVRHPGLSHVYTELMTYSDGSEIYIRSAGALEGKTFDEAVTAFRGSILLGLVRVHGASFTALLNPAPTMRIQAGDRLVVLARSYAAAEPAAAPASGRIGTPGAAAAPDARPMRVLVLGWNSKVPSLLAEFASYTGERFVIDNASIIDKQLRAKQCERYREDPGNIERRFIEADYNHLAELRAIEPWSYDRVVLVGSDTVGSEEDADARTLQGYLLLQQLFKDRDRRPGILVELLEPENFDLLAGRPGEVMISPVILSHMLAQIALRRELRAVFDALFRAVGPEITFKPVAAYEGLAGEVTFRRVQEAAWARGEIALGVVPGVASSEGAGGAASGGAATAGIAKPVLNPDPQASWHLGPADEIVTIVRG